LIKSAFPLARRMQWDGHDYVKLAPVKTFIVKRCAEPACHEMSQVNLTPVLKIVNDLANDTAAAVRSHRCIKVNFAMGAVGACESCPNSAFEGLGTLLAKWRNDAHGLCFALFTQIYASLGFGAADSAHRRIEKRRGRFEQFKLAKRDHISARCAL
jgi:hypothetical protein